ncbi:hypothetical protein Tco_1374379, partial [Tanacetum coccineum]
MISSWFLFLITRIKTYTLKALSVSTALADDELVVGKNLARNGEWIDITMRKVNILLSIDEDAERKNYLKSNPLTSLPLLKVLQGASPSSEIMPLTYQEDSLKERHGLDEKVNSSQKIQESKPVIPQSESS